MAMIEIVDRFLSREEFDYVLDYCESAAYTYGEVDSYGLPPTGMVHQISEVEDIYKLFQSKTQKLVSDIQLYRMYINCFAPSENPYFHTDGDPGDVTFLYYPMRQWELNDGGETQFLMNNEIYGVTPVPNRMVYFDASILHRATAFRNKHRFTVAIKYGTLS
jgi:Rps23 Pro-64 3,4-dihydroxylase Tpa1-like proline 4-hydroxylase